MLFITFDTASHIKFVQFNFISLGIALLRKFCLENNHNIHAVCKCACITLTLERQDKQKIYHTILT